MKNFKEIYKPPFKQDKYCPNIVFTADGERAFDFNEDAISSLLQRNIINILNNSSDKLKWSGKLIVKNSTIILQKENSFRSIISIRGWAHLTGITGLNLSKKEASIIQDNFAKWIIEKISFTNRDSSVPANLMLNWLKLHTTYEELFKSCEGAVIVVNGIPYCTSIDELEYNKIEVLKKTDLPKLLVNRCIYKAYKYLKQKNETY